MRTGKSITELAAEVVRQQEAKKDFISPSRSLAMVPPTEERSNVALSLRDQGQYDIGGTFHGQLSSTLGIPRKYYDRCLEESPALLADNVNHWLQRDDRRRMVRTLDGRARAYLSDGYRPLDNYDLCEAILPVIAESGLSIKSCEITERRLYIQAVSEKLEGEVKVGDIVQGGFVISNSEIGAGSLSIEELFYRLWCKNGCVTGNLLKKYHAGGKAGGVLDDVQAFYRDSTRQLDDAAFFAKVSDTVKHVISRERFEATLARLRGAAEVTLKPVEAVEVVAKRFALNEGEKDSILNNLIEGGDLSVWGVSNAVTRLAHDAENYDRSVEYEKLGNDVIELKPTEWQNLGALAA
jgi:hypothetical protein